MFAGAFALGVDICVLKGVAREVLVIVLRFLITIFSALITSLVE